MEESKYRIVVKTLRDEILGGKWLSPEKPFPSERALVRRFGVSRPTIARALQQLEGQGILLRRQGKGTFLTKAARRLGKAIGLIVPGIGYSEVYPPMCQEISRLAQKHGMTLLFGDISSPNPQARAAQAMDLARKFAKENVSGVILQPIEFLKDSDRINRELLSVFDKAGISVVLIDNDVVPPPDRSSYDIVSFNCIDAGRRVALHLKKCGVRRVCFLMGENWGYCLQSRLLGVKSVFGSAVSVADCDAKSLAAVRRLLMRRQKPDAFICRNDSIAIHLIVTLRRLGKRVPEDVEVVGFNDLNYAQLVDPPLTTIHVPCAEIAQTAFRFLMERIAGPSLPPRECYLPAPLVVRGSTKELNDAR